MSTKIIVNRHDSIWQRASLLGLIAAFIAMGILRLNDCDLFNPDSPRYVIYSQAIVNLGEYRATDLPGSPLYSWRPPGLSLLLTPILAIRPYDVVAAKGVVLLCGALLLWVVFQFASIYSGHWPAMLVTGVVASNPTFLVLSTEVLSEIPFTLGVLIILLVLGRSASQQTEGANDPPRWRGFMALGLVIAVLAFVPWLRTAGVALVAAVGLWSIVSRSRLRWLSAVIVAMAGLGMLAWRNKQAAGENYVGSMFTRIREQGPASTVISALETVRHYLGTAPGLMLPGMTSQRTSYAAMTLDALPTLGVPFAVQAALTAVLVYLAILGMWNRRARGGSLALLFVSIYCACLAVWPWRHERFLWPLIPVMMAYVPAGFFSISSRSVALGKRLVSCGAMILLALCCWQATIGGHLVSVNRELVGDRIAFHSTRFPGFYFSNWRRAGRWLNANSPLSSRVLTWHAAVAGRSHRFQKRVQFETLSPEKLRQQIERFGARYLVVPDGQFGDGFGWQQLQADPGLKLNVVYREQDVAVLEVVPNRTGEVSKTAYPDWLERQLRLVSDARRRLPHRTDLTMRHATLLRESGNDEQAIPILRELFDEGAITARVCAELGWLYFDAGDYADAARFLEMAKGLPNAESIAGVLTEGAAKARERLTEKNAGKGARSINRQLNRVKSLMSSLKYAAAEREAERIIADNPEHPEALFVRGKLHHRLGELEKAEACYERAIALGFADARQWLMLIRLNAAIAHGAAATIDAGNLHETVDPADPAAHVRLSKLFQDLGWTGRALATLEAANERFPNRPTIQKPLAEMYRYFARPELAVALYETMHKNNPDDEAAKKGLESIRALLIEPQMGPS